MFDKGESDAVLSDSLLAKTVSCTVSVVKADRVQATNCQWYLTKKLGEGKEEASSGMSKCKVLALIEYIITPCILPNIGTHRKCWLPHQAILACVIWPLKYPALCYEQLLSQPWYTTTRSLWAGFIIIIMTYYIMAPSMKQETLVYLWTIHSLLVIHSCFQ